MPELSQVPNDEDGTQELWATVAGIAASIWKYKWLVVGTAALVMAASYVVTSRKPRIYEAVCTIEYDPNPSRPLGHTIEDDTANAGWWGNVEYYETQNRIIASRSVAERVVAKLALHHDPDFMGVPAEKRAGWKGTTQVAAASKLQASIRVEQLRDTRIVNIAVRDGDQARAALLANSVADTYMEKILEDRLGSTTSALEWLSKQLDSLKNQLEESELALHEFAEQNEGLSIPLEEQQTIVTSDIQAFNTNLTESRIQRIELSAQLKELASLKADDPLALTVTSLGQDESVQALQASYYDLSTQRAALAIDLGDAHPQMQALDAQLRGVREQLSARIHNIVSMSESDMRKIQSVETGLRTALEEVNRAGTKLNLREITYRRLQRQRDNAAKLYGAILERTAETDLTKALEVSLVRMVDRALKPTVPVAPNLTRSTIVGGILGLLLGLGLATLLVKLDRVIRTVEDAEALGLTILGILPQMSESAQLSGPRYGRRRRARLQTAAATNPDLTVHNFPQSSVAECCRTIRTNLTFMTADMPMRSMLVTSPQPQEGKTTVTLSLAISLAQSGKRILVIDTDLRRPRVHRAFGLPSSVGVTSVLVGASSLKDAVLTTDVPGLSVLTSGPVPPNPAELLHTSQFQRLLQDAMDAFDFVILDTPPLTAVTDAAIIATQVGGVLVVLHGARTTREVLRSSLRQLRDVGARLIGGVLNNVDPSTRGYGAYYYHSAGYYAAHPDEDEAQAETPAAEA
jgi:succinoglycan biosynthesis transport protein ExoP